jgi:hypothetical protein
MAIFTNGEYGGEVCSEIANAALKEFLAISPQVLEPREMSREELKEYCGLYDIPVMSCRVLSDSKGLLINITDKGGIPTPSSPPRVQPPPARVAFYDRDKIMGIKSPYMALRAESLRDPAGKIEWLMIMHRAHKREGKRYLASIC